MDSWIVSSFFFLTCYSPTWHPLAIRGGTIHPNKTSSDQPTTWRLWRLWPLWDCHDWWVMIKFSLTSLERRHRRDIWQDLLQLTTGSCGLPSSNEKPEVFDTGNFWWISGQHLASYFDLFFPKTLPKNEGCHCCYVNLYFEYLKMPGILCHKLIPGIQHDWTIIFLGFCWGVELANLAAIHTSQFMGVS